MAGIVFIVIFALFVLPPFYLIGKLSLTSKQKLIYRIFAFLFPICIGLFTYHFNILNNNIDTWTQLDRFLSQLITILVAGGSWIVFLIACFNQQKQVSSTPNEGK